MKDLTLERFAGLVRTGAVFRVYLVPYPDIDGGGWMLDIDHGDPELSRLMHTQRGGVRVFRTADAAIRTVHATGYGGSFVVQRAGAA